MASIHDSFVVMSSSRPTPNPANTARSFAQPAKVLAEALVKQLLAKRPAPSVLEYGGGNLRNALYLQRRGHAVTVIELERARERFPARYENFVRLGGKVLLHPQGEPTITIRRKFHIALATFVLETICAPSERRALLQHCRGQLKPDGTLILSARGFADVVPSIGGNMRYSDGFVTAQGTFVRSFSKRAIIGLLSSSGFRDVIFLGASCNPTPRFVHAIARP